MAHIRFLIQNPVAICGSHLHRDFAHAFNGVQYHQDEEVPQKPDRSRVEKHIMFGIMFPIMFRMVSLLTT